MYFFLIGSCAAKRLSERNFQDEVVLKDGGVSQLGG
jgi:hypothetical protein